MRCYVQYSTIEVWDANDFACLSSEFSDKTRRLWHHITSGYYSYKNKNLYDPWIHGSQFFFKRYELNTFKKAGKSGYIYLWLEIFSRLWSLQLLLHTILISYHATVLQGVPSLDDDIYGFGVIILQLLTKQIFPIGTHTHVAHKIEKQFAQGEPVVHEKLRLSGCSKEDASTITGLAVRLTNRPFQNAQGEWFNLYRPDIASVTQVLNTLHVVQRNAIHRGFLMLKLKAQAIKTKIMKK